MPNEKELRRPDFLAESAPITLLDGQQWYLPRPWVRFAPSGNTLGYKLKVWFLERFDATLSELMQAREEMATGGRGGDIVATNLRIITYMLRLNYNLADEQLEELVQFGGDPRAAELEADFRAILNGVESPKPSTAGADSASSPAA